ncbi:hypothetical protein EHF33_16350 (plasmid) [Deinococcus psychrotolerans]|uniref:Uncharacterized protein n=1 Tax=Deinococcus psychrotolerans TaxID=2489213 RepID=A0A3G8YTB3_9DEIO|nr:hypothetical protein [Deinococcus psychrotolerans]AZI44486.1 hypothetical protein EHF33_16350 [Deinococcus psychrotolerans]
MSDIQKNKADYIAEIKDFSIKLDGIFLEEAGFEQINCPKYLMGLFPLKKRRRKTLFCFDARI